MTMLARVRELWMQFWDNPFTMFDRSTPDPDHNTMTGREEWSAFPATLEDAEYVVRRAALRVPAYRWSDSLKVSAELAAATSNEPSVRRAIGILRRAGRL